MQDDKMSYTEYRSLINSITEKNAILGESLLDNFHQNLPEHIKKQMQKILNITYFEQINKKNKNEWMCEHDGCDEKSCYSHEISERKFLKTLANKHAKVLILKPDMKNNPALLSFTETHIRDASNFYGYCAKHDQELFNDIDSKSHILDIHFINKQCARTIRQKIQEIKTKIMGVECFLSNLKKQWEFIEKNNITEGDELGSYLKYMRNKIDILCARLSRSVSTYNCIWNEFDRGNYLIKFKEINVKKTGYCFSDFFDFTLDNDSQNCFIWMLKLDIENEPKAFICWLDNEVSSKFISEMEENLHYHITSLIYMSKKKLIFSHEFANKFQSQMKKILSDNMDERIEINPVFIIILSKVFGFL